MEKPVNILLDLDNTLISSEPTEDLEDYKEMRMKAKKFKFRNMDDYYIVFERPHLQEFLDFLFSLDDVKVSVWSAATKDYVLWVIDNVILIKPGRKIDFTFFSYHSDLSRKRYKTPKKLKILWDIFNLPEFNRNNTLILDDLKSVYNVQKKNVIPVYPFEFTRDGSENDRELLDLKDKIIQRINGTKPSVQSR